MTERYCSDEIPLICLWNPPMEEDLLHGDLALLFGHKLLAVHWETEGQSSALMGHRGGALAAQDSPGSSLRGNRCLGISAAESVFSVEEQTSTCSKEWKHLLQWRTTGTKKTFLTFPLQLFRVPEDEPVQEPDEGEVLQRVPGVLDGPPLETTRSTHETPQRKRAGGVWMKLLTSRMVLANSDTDGWKWSESWTSGGEKHRKGKYHHQYIYIYMWYMWCMWGLFLTLCSSHRVVWSAPQYNGFLCSGS